MGGLNYIHKFIDFCKSSITLEPVIVFYTFAAFILDGSKITTNLLIYKICNLTDIHDFNNFTIGDPIDCYNLTWINDHGEHVMKDVNSFQVSMFYISINDKYYYINMS